MSLYNEFSVSHVLFFTALVQNILITTLKSWRLLSDFSLSYWNWL